MYRNVKLRLMSIASVLAWGVLFLFAPTVAQAGIVLSDSAPDFASAQYVSRTNFSTDFNANVLNSASIPYVVIVQQGRPSQGGDFYRFSHLGGIVHLDIDSAPVVTNFDPWVSIWNAAGNLIGQRDDNGGDPGDISGVNIGGFYNSNLSNLILAPGDYVVGVVGYPSNFFDGGSFSGALIPIGGTYTLNISSGNSAVPEPTSMAIFGLGTLGLAHRAHRKRRTHR